MRNSLSKFKKFQISKAKAKCIKAGQHCSGGSDGCDLMFEFEAQYFYLCGEEICWTMLA